MKNKNIVSKVLNDRIAAKNKNELLLKEIRKVQSECIIKCNTARIMGIRMNTALEIQSVSEAHVAYGEYDLVAIIDFEDEKEMAKTLIGNMGSIPGVQKTETLIAVEA